MLRSFDYAAFAAATSFAELDPGSSELVRGLAETWRAAAASAFLEAYRATIGDCPSYPQDPAEAARLLDLFLLEKALYAICYEAANRPHWVRIPLKGVTSLLDLEATDDHEN